MLPVVAVVPLVVVVIVAIVVVVRLVVTLVNEDDVNAGDVVLSVVVFFVGRGLVDVSKWDVVM